MAQPLARPDLSDLTVRVLSAAVIMPLAVAAIWLGGWPFLALIVLVAAAMGWEWSTLCGVTIWQRVLVAAVMVISALLAFYGAYREAFSCIIAGSLFVAVLSRIGRSVAPVLLPLGVVYVAVALLAIVWLRLLPEAGLLTVLWMASVVVATDVGAYFSGRSIGGPKLAPRISPSKTWSGLAGGVTCAVIAGVLDVLAMGTGAIVQIAVLSGVLAVVAQSGDLIESVVKRHFGVKDAGNLIPGHGGVLDRLDGFLTVAPVTGLMTWIAGGSPLKWQ